MCYTVIKKSEERGRERVGERGRARENESSMKSVIRKTCYKPTHIIQESTSAYLIHGRDVYKRNGNKSRIGKRDIFSLLSFFFCQERESREKVRIRRDRREAVQREVKQDYMKREKKERV